MQVARPRQRGVEPPEQPLFELFVDAVKRDEGAIPTRGQRHRDRVRLAAPFQVVYPNSFGSEPILCRVGKRADHLDPRAGTRGRHRCNHRAAAERPGTRRRPQLLAEARQSPESVEDEVLEGLTGGNEIDGQGAASARAIER